MLAVTFNKDTGFTHEKGCFCLYYVPPLINYKRVVDIPSNRINIPLQNYPSVVENPLRPKERYSARTEELITNPPSSRSNPNQFTKRQTGLKRTEVAIEIQLSAFKVNNIVRSG